MTNAESLTQFFKLYADGKQAALDVNPKTGEVSCMTTRNLDTGAIGNGTPGIPHPHMVRLASCKAGAIAIEK